MAWIAVRTDADIQLLNETYGNFEDAVIVHMEYVSGDYVDENFCGYMKQKNDLKVIFQRLDDNPFSIELWFLHTKTLHFAFVNPADNCMSDILYAKVCRNDSSIFWTVWKDFDPCDKAHLSGTTLIESEELKWRMIK